MILVKILQYFSLRQNRLFIKSNVLLATLRFGSKVEWTLAHLLRKCQRIIEVEVEDMCKLDMPRLFKICKKSF